MAKYRKPGSRPDQPVNPADQEDAFVAKTLEFSNWAQRNRPILILGVVIAGVGIASLLYYRSYRDTLNTAAATQLEELQQRLGQGDQTGVQADLQLYLDRFSGTPFADEARVALAQITANMGDHAAAAEVLEPLAGDVEDPLGAQATALLAAISEDAGNRQLAEGLYERLADRAGLDFQIRDALADAARLHREQGDMEGGAGALRPAPGRDGRKQPGTWRYRDAQSRGRRAAALIRQARLGSGAPMDPAVPSGSPRKLSQINRI